MKKWRAAIGFVLLLLVGMLPANIRQAEAGRIDELPTGTSAGLYFTSVNIEDATIEGGESATFSVGNFRDQILTAINNGTIDIAKIKWNVKKNGVDYTTDASYLAMFSESTNTDTFKIKAVEGNCILDGAKVSLTIYVSSLSTGENQTITFSETATLTVSHTSSDWDVDEEASSGAVQVSHKTCIYCEKELETKTAVVPLVNPVYVGGQALQNAGESVAGNSGTATLYIAQDGSPVLVLDNYVYTGAGYENTDDNYAGIYYGGSDTLYIFCGPNEDSRAVSQNTITVTAEGVKCSRGIYVPNGTLHIGTTGNETEDTLTVTAGTATKYSDGILANQFKVQDATIDFYTSTNVNSTGQYELTTNCVINATGGNTTGDGASTSTGISCATLNVSGGTLTATGGIAEGYALPYSYGINCTDAATFSGGKITANGGKASYEGMTAHTLWARTYGINAASISISGADVTATGGTCGDLVSGKDNTRESYGCYGNITMTAGSLTATGGNLLMEDSSTGDRISYGIYGSISASQGTIEATGGNTRGGKSYGIYLNKDSRFSGEAEVTATTKPESTDDYRYGIYVKETNLTLTVEDSANVTATVAEGANRGASGIYANSSDITFIQTGGSVVASAPEANQAGAHFKKADISGGTFSASAKGTAFYAYDLNLTGGDITGTSTSTLEDTMNVVSTGIKIETLTMTGGRLTGKGGKLTTLQSYGVYLTGTADVSGGTITGTGGHVFSENQDVMSYGINIAGTLTLSGGTITGIGGQASDSSFGVYVASNATLSEEAVLEGIGGVSGRGNSTGISLSGGFTMSAGSSAQVTGNGGSGVNSMGIKYAGSTLSLLGGSLTATGGTGTTASYGLYTTNNFLMDGTLLIAKGNTSAVGCNSSKEISSDVIVVSTDIAGTSTSPLQYGGHVISTLAEYKYLKAGTTSDVGAVPGKRDISGATITLASSSLTYNGTEQTMTVTSVKLGSVELLDEVTISGNTATDAGTYTLTVTAKDDSYYTGSAEKTFTVDPLKITPDVTVTGDPYAYKSTVDSSAVIVKYGEIILVEGVDYRVEIRTSTVGENGGIAYVYPINSGSNYTFDRVDAYFTVVKAANPVEVTTPVTVIRGGNWVNLTYSNNQASTTPSFSFVGDALGCTITNRTLTSGDTAGTVTVEVTFPASDQYNEAVRTITVTITDKNRAELDWVTLTDADYEYNGETELNTVTHALPGSRAKEDIIEYSGTTRSGETYARSTTPPTQAGNYTVYVTYETKDTIYTGSDDFVIRPKDISNLITVTLGDALTYNGTEQTQTVTEVYDANAGYTFNETEYDITGNKQTDASIFYHLYINGKGNFTGTKTVSYEIAKATPTLGDFEIPSYDREVDYTGVAVELPLPTTNKIGMGNTYIETYVRDAGTYDVTFKVYAGDNYTAASGFTYGTITVNKVYRNISTTDAIVGINGKTIDLNERVTGEENIGTTFTIVDGDDLGCRIDSSTFTSGSKAGNVTVQVTVSGNDNYRDTIRTFTVEVVEVGGVEVWGGVTSSGSSSDENTIQLLQGDEVKYEMTMLGNSILYSFDGVAAGTYTLRVSKANHITVEKEVTVASEDVHVDVELKQFTLFGANMILGNELSMNFYVNKSYIDADKEYYIKVTKTYADGRDDVVRIYNQEDWYSYSSSLYRVTFNGINAKEMNDTIYVQVFYADGTSASALWKDSVVAYVTRILENQNAYTKTMLVDMLNYGSAAQVSFDYDEENLANSNLTEAQKAYATSEVSYSDSRVKGTNYYGSTLSLGSNLCLVLYFQNISTDMYAEVTFVNHYGEEKAVRIEGTEFYHHSGSIYKVAINEVVVADVGQPVTCTIYDSLGNEVGTVTDSIESYIARMSSTDELYETIMKFANSAYVYLHNK